MVGHFLLRIYNTDVTPVTPVVLCVIMLSGMRLIDYCVYYKLRLEIFLHSNHGRSLGWNFTEARDLAIDFFLALFIYFFFFLHFDSSYPTSQITLSKRCDNVTFSLLQRNNFMF
jgi:hypothetical protein